MDQCQESPELEAEIEQELLTQIKLVSKNFDVYVQDFKKLMSHCRELSDFVEVIKNLEIDMDACKKLLDRRRKFSTAFKLELRMAMIFLSYDHIASKLRTSDGNKISAKWISFVNSDESLDRILTRANCCPACNWDHTRWLEQAAAAEKVGRKIRAIPNNK